MKRGRFWVGHPGAWQLRENQMRTCGRGLSLSQLDGTGTVLQGGLALGETRKLSVAEWERDWPEPRDGKKQTVP